MNKILYHLCCLCLCITIIAGGTSAVYANNDVVNKKRIIGVNENNAIQEMNIKFEECEVLKQQDIKEIEEYADLKYNKLNNGYEGITIKNKTPDKTIYFDDGSKIEDYTTVLLIGNWEKADPSVTQSSILSSGGSKDYTFTTFDVTMYVKMSYTQYTCDGDEYTRLDTGYAKLVRNDESGQRNLIINPGVSGCWKDPDGNRGMNGWIHYPRTIASPQIGTLYSKATNNPHYYATGTEAGRVEVEVTVELTHNGSTWYTSDKFELSEGFN